MFFPRFGGVVICINEIHMNFLELFLTLIHIKMKPATQKHTSMYIETYEDTHTHTHTHTHTAFLLGVCALETS